MIWQISSLCLQQNAPRPATLCARRNAEAPPLPCFKAFIRAGRFLRSNEEGRLLSMNVRTDEAAAERQRNVIAHRTSRKEGRENLVEGCKTTACSAAFYAPPKTFNLVGLVGSRRIVYNEAARGQRRMYESKYRCNDRNVLSPHRSSEPPQMAEPWRSGSSGYRKRTLS